MLPTLNFTKVALLLLASTTLHAVSAHPSILETDTPSPLAIRATGKYVGATCTSDAECYSKNCVLYGSLRQKTCRRQPSGGPCFEANNCGSRSCVQGRCQSSDLNGPCDTVSDCIGTSLLCDAGACKVNPNVGPTSAPNQACRTGSDCASERCEALTYCLDPTGKEGPCSSCFPGTGFDPPCEPAPLHCTRLPLGASCANNGDCAEGFCRSGTCAVSQSGDACVSEAQCTGTSICGTRGTCHTPAKRTLYTQDICGADSQCKNGRCRTGLNFTDVYDQSFQYTGQYTYPPRCDYLSLGESNCRTYSDCTSGICKNAVCVLGADGDRCLFNQHCANLCGADGICQPLPAQGSVALKQPCTADNQCASGRCDGDYGFIARPLPYDPSKTQYVMDKLCS
ncbi:unnamed protein product [Tilletia controversa]|uniref:Uncharacterized protein n=3 Tax=Tilletia TaxID=13289 RepID=A0A8X7SXB6_9BASI|nr:hypothetical protein CF336_g8040 [Tilletia laevis]KAE8198802.1 hypothetical protein CF328_g3444 [Tilletia controversa]KAE8260974.1 hypothetical protein A4X03_0g3653 [Tilletia caries]KAE8201657.1 hypothetical protein CF335_g3691 [Tilletia laevis]KAE8247853.1 hypothetical protein A4X06_0g4148 [Tilletia controversa]